VSGQEDELTSGEEQLLKELWSARYAAEGFYQKWLDARFDGTAPPEDPGLPYREAQRIANIKDPVLAAIFPNMIDLARVVVEAMEKCEDALNTAKAELAYSHPGHLEEMNRKLRELREGWGSS
jgi:hypothetical protein